jgi:hypothetical protein
VGETPHACVGGGLEQIARAFDIGGMLLRVVARKRCGDVKNDRAAFAGTQQDFWVTQIAQLDFSLQAPQHRNFLRGTDEGANVCAIADKPLHQRAAEKAGRACDQYLLIAK